MRSYIRSLRYAIEGITHAFKTERNLKLFGVLYAISLFLSWLFGVPVRSWEIVVFTGGIFLAFELMNTALEHFTDAFDDDTKSRNRHHTAAIKATKDIAAGASLVCAMAWGATLVMIFLPYAMSFIRGTWL